MNMTFKDTIHLIKMDLSRFGNENESKMFILTSPSLMITFWFRIGSWLYYKKKVLAKICNIPIKIIYKINTLLTGIQMPLGTSTGGVSDLSTFHV